MPVDVMPVAQSLPLDSAETTRISIHVPCDQDFASASSRFSHTGYKVTCFIVHDSLPRIRGIECAVFDLGRVF